MNDGKWMLCFIACNIIVVGLFRSILVPQAGLVPLIIGAAFFVPAFVPFYLLRLGAFVIVTLLLWLDFFLRFNAFSLIYSLIGVYHVYLLLRWRPEAKKEEESP
jgi:cytochrome c biogenesis factor